MKRIGYRRGFRAVMVAASCLAASAPFGQTLETLADEAYEVMPQQDPLPLGQLVDTDAPLPNLADLDFDAPVAKTGSAITPELWAEAGLPDAVPVDEGAARVDAVREAGADTAIAPTEPPASWARHDFQGTQFAVPGDWVIMEEGDLELGVFSGDLSPPTGHILMISITDRDGHDIDEVLASAGEEAGAVRDRGEVLLSGGEVLDWADLDMTLGGAPMRVRMYVSRSMFTEDRAPLLLMVGAVGAAEPFDPAVRDAFLSSFRFAAPAPLPEETPQEDGEDTGRMALLGGRFTLTPPAGWMVIEYPDEAALTSPEGTVSVRFLRAVEVRQRLDRLPDGADHEAGTLAGNPVHAFGTEEGTLNVWTQCPGPDAPLAALVSGGPEFRSSDAFGAIFDELVIDGMTGAPDCSFVTGRTGAASPEGATQKAPQAAEDQPNPDWVRHEWQGVRFAVPDGWTLHEKTNESFVVTRWTTSPGEGHVLKISLDKLSGSELEAAMRFSDDLGITVQDQGDRTIGGAEPFRWVTFDDREDAISTTLFAANEPFGETGKYLNIAIASNGSVPQLDADIRHIFLGSFQFGPSQAGGTTQSGPEELEPGPVAEDEGAGPDPDSFEQIGGGYTTYRNARYGTNLSYPGSYFIAQPAPGSGDGRRFESVDGQAHFIMFTQYDALERGLDGMRADIRADLDDVQEETSDPGVFEITGTEGQTRRFFKVIRNADGLTRRLEIAYPVAREAEFQAVVTYMAKSFGPPPELSVAVPQPPGQVMVPQPPYTQDAPSPLQEQGPRVTDFSNGRVNGWMGLLTELQPQVTGGPEGRGYLESVSPGDGNDGYYVAPPEFHGDWRGLDTIEVQLRGNTGDYYGDPGRAGVDIIIESDHGTALTGFDRQVGPAWMTQRVRLDDPDRWMLTGGASRLEDVLTNVTGFRIRAEYILGDTSGGLARVAVARTGADERQSADPARPSGGPAPVIPGDIFTPERGSATRGAVIDAARGPIEDEIELPILFVIDVLNTDGTWAYLQATPVNRDGTPLDWQQTRFAREMAGGFMSDVVMVLLRKDFGGWGVLDYVLGPTDVAWYNWVDQHGLPERFFMK
ncbi:hypothetical protein ACEWPM_016250 [Roseovarius sp. S4756]|uniref:hypothetical protein n=1 Tax=Roseovarius maritimus TaxID=3342637 RepID=UPI003729394C